MNLPRVGIVKFIILGKITFMRNELNLIANRQFDLLVIGGGITGAGVAHDAAARGLKVALVEKKTLLPEPRGSRPNWFMVAYATSNMAKYRWFMNLCKSVADYCETLRI